MPIEISDWDSYVWTEGHLGPSVNGKSFTLLSKDCCDQLLATQVLPGTHKMFFFDWYLCGIGKNPFQFKGVDFLSYLHNSIIKAAAG